MLKESWETLGTRLVLREFEASGRKAEAGSRGGVMHTGGFLGGDRRRPGMEPLMPIAAEL